MGSHLSTHAYFLIVLEARHSVCSREIASSDSLTNRAQSSSALCKTESPIISSSIRWEFIPNSLLYALVSDVSKDEEPTGRRDVHAPP